MTLISKIICVIDVLFQIYVEERSLAIPTNIFTKIQRQSFTPSMVHMYVKFVRIYATHRERLQQDHLFL